MLYVFAICVGQKLYQLKLNSWLSERIGITCAYYKLLEGNSLFGNTNKSKIKCIY